MARLPSLKKTLTFAVIISTALLLAKILTTETTIKVYIKSSPFHHQDSAEYYDHLKSRESNRAIRWKVYDIEQEDEDSKKPDSRKVELKQIESEKKMSAVDKWEQMTALERGNFQQSEVEKFCKRHSTSKTDVLHKMGKHILINNRTKTAFCYAPKVGCTSLKILFLLTKGVIPEKELTGKAHEQVLLQAIFRNSFEGKSLKTKRNVVNNFFKFVMYRNPVVRLVSAYKSKVERLPLIGLKNEVPHYNWLRKKIYAFKHPRLYQEWTSEGGKTEINIPFVDFIDYWLKVPKTLKFDEHFQPIFELCQPCEMQYNYYGNFDNFDRDADVLIEQMKSNKTLLKDGYDKKGGPSTTDAAVMLYNALTEQQKRQIIDRLALDLSFYYSIFPIERDSHKRIMTTNYSISVAELHF